MKYCVLCGEKYFDQQEFCSKDGTELVYEKKGTDPLIGSTLKNMYRIEEVISKGGMGVVYRATQHPLGRSVALKLLPKELIETPEDIQRFYQEAKIVSQLYHPNIVTLIDFDKMEEKGTPFIVMEYLHGVSLKEYIKNFEQLPKYTILSIMERICAGIKAAHQQELIHRDLKPANIMLAQTSNGEEVLKILDFGIATTINKKEDFTVAGTFVGTAGYVSPEQLKGQKADFRSDIYSLGALLYFLIKKVRPYDCEPTQKVFYRQVVETPSTLDFENLGPLQGMDLVVTKAMDLDPNQRYQSVDEFLFALKDICDNYSDDDFLYVNKDEHYHVELENREVISTPSVKWGQYIFLFLIIMGFSYFSFTQLDFIHGYFDKDELSQGVSKSEILLGMTGDFSGVDSGKAITFREGMLSYFKHVNEDSSGVNNRRIRLLSLDDKGDVQRSCHNAANLVSHHKIFACVGNVGVLAGQTVQPILSANKMISFGTLSNPQYTEQKPPNPYVFNYRPCMSEEATALLWYYLKVKKLRLGEIALFTKDTDNGRECVRAIKELLKRYNYAPINVDNMKHVIYSDDELNIDKILDKKDESYITKGVIAIECGDKIIPFVKTVRDSGMDALVGCISDVDGEKLGKKLSSMGNKYTNNIVMTSVVPFGQRNLPIHNACSTHVKRFFPQKKYSQLHLEGYVTAKLFCHGLSKVGAQVHTDSLIKTFENMSPIDLGLGGSISFSSNDHQGVNRIWGAQLLKDGTYQSISLEPENF